MNNEEAIVPIDLGFETTLTATEPKVT